MKLALKPLAAFPESSVGSSIATMLGTSVISTVSTAADVVLVARRVVVVGASVVSTSSAVVVLVGASVVVEGSSVVPLVSTAVVLVGSAVVVDVVLVVLVVLVVVAVYFTSNV